MASQPLNLRHGDARMQTEGSIGAAEMCTYDELLWHSTRITVIDSLSALEYLDLIRGAGTSIEQPIGSEIEDPRVLVNRWP